MRVDVSPMWENRKIVSDISTILTQKFVKSDDRMKFLWIFAFVAFLFGFAAAECPRGFSPAPTDPTLCGAQRVIKGECPPLSRYDANKNLCIYVARG
ncbi:hypothetical protein HA402_003191 [Bradysia odoriphaga]|nr:hypothetical protein HA402_003191 [Bradysia odoriphaga]